MKLSRKLELQVDNQIYTHTHTHKRVEYKRSVELNFIDVFKAI